jgi:hypothetical protein
MQPKGPPSNQPSKAKVKIAPKYLISFARIIHSQTDSGPKRKVSTDFYFQPPRIPPSCPSLCPSHALKHSQSLPKTLPHQNKPHRNCVQWARVLPFHLFSTNESAGFTPPFQFAQLTSLILSLLSHSMTSHDTRSSPALLRIAHVSFIFSFSTVI